MRRKSIVVMVKPSSALCNLRCTYCFYRDEAENRQKGIRPFISEEVTDRLLLEIGRCAEQAYIVFQGGEPSLIGLDYFRAFVAKESTLAPQTVFSHGFQTNGYTIDDEWAEFFAENRFLVGISFDGGRKIHDLYRPVRDGSRSSSRILESIRLLKDHGVDFNILTVVTSSVAENPDYVWSFLKGRELRYLQFIPCMDSLDGSKADYSLSCSQYGSFLCRLFDLWYADFSRGDYVSVRLFDNLIQMIQGYPPESCDLFGRCSVQYVCESDGQIYPCDFYSMDSYRLGNILDSSIEEIDARRRELSFIEASAVTCDECQTCPCYIICRGGCPRYRENGRYLFCESMKQLYKHAFPRMNEIAIRYSRHQGS